MGEDDSSMYCQDDLCRCLCNDYLMDVPECQGDILDFCVFSKDKEIEKIAKLGMLNGVHGNTSHLRPAVSLYPVFMISTTSLQDRLVNTSTTSNNTNHGTICRGENLLGS